MRVTSAQGYDEPRDSLAQDWPVFLASALPGIRWVMLPNLGTASVDYARNHGVNALILTGGDDIGQNGLKDSTDLAMLAHALRAGWPVLGVCRGLQVMQHHLGGELTKMDENVHVAHRHAIAFDPGAPLDSRPPTNVNSYHRYGIRSAANGLRPLASAGDDSVEAAVLEGHRAYGVMWHPEREPAATEYDIALMRHVFAT
jgi:gamma-glutamyl-gamma-aminobutyrate hydrolase PuuD